MSRFRFNQSSTELIKEAEDYLTGKLPEDIRQDSLQGLRKLYKKLGPAVDNYPTWHPIVRNQSALKFEDTCPSEKNGYKGLDHTILFRNGFISCPYDKSDKIIQSVKDINSKNQEIWQRFFDDKELSKAPPFVLLNAQTLDFPLYNTSTTAVMVTCGWHEEDLQEDGTIAPQTLFSLFFDHETPAWRCAELAESWETMRELLLGRPCGARSSLFVNQQTGQTLKNVYNTLVFSGACGSLDKVQGKKYG